MTWPSPHLIQIQAQGSRLHPIHIRTKKVMQRKALCLSVLLSLCCSLLFFFLFPFFSFPPPWNECVLCKWCNRSSVHTWSLLHHFMHAPLRVLIGGSRLYPFNLWTEQEMVSVWWASDATRFLIATQLPSGRCKNLSFFFPFLSFSPTPKAKAKVVVTSVTVFGVRVLYGKLGAYLRVAIGAQGIIF
jgi:hypothetical protein